MADRLKPRTAIDRGPMESPIQLDPRDPEYLPEAGGDTAATDIDSNVGGAPASAGLDSGGAVGVRRGRAVGRPGFEYEGAPHGETSSESGLEGELQVVEEEEEERGEITNEEEALVRAEAGDESANLPA